MPRKINKRKKIQAARRKAEQSAKPKPRIIGIAHNHSSGVGLSTLLASILQRDNYEDEKHG